MIFFACSSSESTTNIDDTATEGEQAQYGDVIVNEIQWMGSYEDSGYGHYEDEFIELYNTKSYSINISGWYIGGARAVGGAYVIPNGNIIPANGYFVIANSLDYAFPYADIGDEDISLPNTGLRLELKDVVGTVIDIADDGTGDPMAGLNDTTNKIRKSMERISVSVSGDVDSNWKTCTQTGNKVQTSFKTKTIATPGESNS